jgi:hypothetical protein
MTFALWQQVKLTATFKNSSGAFYDPASPVAVVVPPNGTVALVPLVKGGGDPVGTATATITAEALGDWEARAQASATQLYPAPLVKFTVTRDGT